MKTNDMFFAHSENPSGEKHGLIDHLLATAELTRSFSTDENLQNLFYLAGLIHDVGKFQDDFQLYLLEGKPRTPHAGIGAFIAKQLAGQLPHLQFVIKGHHAGIPNKEEVRENHNAYNSQRDLISKLIARFQTATGLQDLAPFSVAADLSDPLIVECTTRFLFSALTDADWLDTERHFNPDLSEARLSIRLDCSQLLTKLETKYQDFPTEGTINQLRSKARTEVAQHAQDDIGFFSLQLPTGLGKTLTSVYWALLHARHHRLERVIVVLPYINIIDQTAQILKDIFGGETVLEHHSGIIDEDHDHGGYTEDSVGVDLDLAKRLACENWDAPIIVTTTVQFFESLFSNRPFRCRKNHNVARSVIILDEVQTLPKQYAEPIIIMLRNMQQSIRSSFLFCTATQPALAKRGNFDGIENIRPLVTQPQQYFSLTRRVEYSLLEGLNEVSLANLADQIAMEHESLLVIVNTKSVAKELFHKVIESGSHEQFYHLSTGMCPHHRKAKIAEITDALKSHRRIVVVSTQLVEAGVDLDFPCVYRAIGPLDSVIQAAGRCNRNGLLNGSGRVVLFHLEQHKMPDATYAACAQFAKGLIQDDSDLLHHPSSFEKYHEQVLSLFVNADRYRITDQRKKFNFKDVAEGFRLIDEPVTALFIKNYSDDSHLLLHELQQQLTHGKMTRGQWRKAQQFSVQVYPDFLKKYDSQIEIFHETIRIWHGHYDNNTGLSPKDVETVF